MIGLAIDVANQSDLTNGKGPTYMQHPNDDAYLSSIEQYKNESWYDRLLENPWLYSKQASFVPSFWQKIGEGIFGDYSSRQRYYADLQTNQQQWLSDTLQQMHQQDYDAAPAQAARERAAGLNPDLNGQVTPGSAAENDQPMMPGASMDLGTDALQVGQGAMNFLGFILNGAQAFQGLGLGMQQFVSNELSNNQSALDFLINKMGLTGKYEDLPDLDAVSDEDIIASVKSAGHNLSGYSRATQHYLRNVINSVTPDSLAVRDIRERLKTSIANARKQRVEIEGSPAYDKDFQTWVNDYARMIGNFEYETWKIEQTALRKGWNADKLGHELRIIQNQAENDLYNFVRGGNKWYNTLGILGLPYLRTGLSNAVTAGINFLSARGLKRMPNLNSSTSTSYVHSFKH